MGLLSSCSMAAVCAAPFVLWVHTICQHASTHASVHIHPYNSRSSPHINCPRTGLNKSCVFLCAPWQVDIFGWVSSTSDAGTGTSGAVASSTELPSLADPTNLVQLSFWQLSSGEAQNVIWQANMNRWDALRSTFCRMARPHSTAGMAHVV